MIYEIVLSRQADSDLRGIYEYIAFELLAPENAERQLSRLEDGILKLSEYPESHRVYDKEPWKSRGLRVLAIDNYLVFYIVDKAKSVVEIVRVMYQGRDTDKHLK